MDLNGLKRTNDSLGHAAGDELIQNAGLIIDESFKDYGTSYRIGGDEFTTNFHIFWLLYLGGTC